MPNSILPFVYFLAFVLLASVSQLNARIQNAFYPNPWKNPQFIQEFLGLYGTNPKIEPQITPIDHQLLQKASVLIDSNPSLAINLLESNRTKDSSAAIDFTLGMLNLQSKNHDRAILYLQNAIKKFPPFLRAHKSLAITYLQRDQYSHAIQQFQKSLALGSPDGLTLSGLGYSFLQQGKYASAENAYRQAIVFFPTNPDIRNGLITALTNMNRHYEVIGIIEEALTESPHEKELWLAKINSLNSLDRSEEALIALEMLERLSQGTQASFLQKGDLSIYNDLPDFATKAYATATTQKPIPWKKIISSLELMIHKGYAEHASKLLSWIQKNHNNIPSSSNLILQRLQAELLLSQGKDKEAVNILKALLKQDPLDGNSLILTGNYYSKVSDAATASHYYQLAQELEDFRVKAYIQEARMHVQLWNLQKAVNLLTKAQQIDYQNNIEDFKRSIENILNRQ